MIWLIFIAIGGLVVFLYFRWFKIPKIKNLVFVDGGLGTGKTAWSVALSIRLYKRNFRRWKIRKFLCKLLHRPLPEEPLLYSNLPLSQIKHVPLTADVLLRKKRVAYKSVVLIDEMNLVIDQFDFRDSVLNEELSKFFKLFRHESHGGFLIANSQSTSDLHFAFKNCLSDYMYIHHKRRLPIISVLKVQELAYSNDKNGSVIVNNRDSDIEDDLRNLIILNRVFKRYDTYCYSILTDGLPVEDEYLILERKQSLKAHKLLTLKKRGAK